MPKDRFTVSPFPDIHVSELERQELLHIVDMHVEDYISKYVDHVLVDKRKVDKQRWEHVKSKDKLHVYAERTRKELSRRGIEPESSLRATQRVQDTSETKDLPVVMGVGTLVGELDDLMFGVVNPTLDEMRIKASYVQDIDAAAVLCPVVGPSKEDPFRSLVIKWMAIDVPLQSTKLVKSRDFVFIEATGTTYLPNGDRVGYHLLHSIDFPQTKPLPKKIRGNLSVFSCFRKKRGYIIENFAWGIVDPGGEIMRSLAISVAAGTLLSATNYVHCGQMKKLSWMLQRLHTIESHGSARQKKQCVVCDKRTSSAIGSIGKSTCKICCGSVCHSCKIRQRISFIAPGGQLIQHKIVICAGCMKDATRWNAQEAARDEVVRQEVISSSAYSFMDTSESSLDEFMFHTLSATCARKKIFQAAAADTSPLAVVKLVFRAKSIFDALVLDTATSFIDCVEMELCKACKCNSILLLNRIWEFSIPEMYPSPADLGPGNGGEWSRRKYLRTDKHYKRYQFRRAIIAAVKIKEEKEALEMVKWLFAHFSGCIVPFGAVHAAVGGGKLEISRFFKKHEIPPRTDGGRAMRDEVEAQEGNVVRWGRHDMAKAAAKRQNEVVYWLYKNTHAPRWMKNILLNVVYNGDVALLEWLCDHYRSRGTTRVNDGEEDVDMEEGEQDATENALLSCAGRVEDDEMVAGEQQIEANAFMGF